MNDTEKCLNPFASIKLKKVLKSHLIRSLAFSHSRKMAITVSFFSALRVS